ncbi:MAG: hypothetical protein HY342_13560 [Candidatus Lambdaproteobacteria bacterium]|nr:hypothetical protein [Candidatus Lambdaproteobacteria bacterium]
MKDRRHIERRRRERRILERRSYDMPIEHEERRVMGRRLLTRRKHERRTRLRRDRAQTGDARERVYMSLSRELLEWFDKMAAAKKISRMELFNQALEEYYRNH